ncbi:FAD-binding oxidoreductase [Acinetobacter rudis]|uniref:NAD(P)/FAD-dependent oxidoreductase n=1 Tax=Acinetobacter rudis TaxID=632955 RepID=UPI00280EF0E8|nr:FAD-binding oxidoreductase [Acinetobacter rudis]MDQ8953367.1 FAD-binding oxidoreductase [Acinetobacter rudis]
MKFDVLVLGAGMVGVSCALHLQQKGKSVALFDKGLPGEETSFGNAGIIQREAIEPYGFPRDFSTIFQTAFNSRLDVRYHFSALTSLIKPLATYYHNSSQKFYPKICKEYESIIARSIETHIPFIEQANVEHLVNNQGFMEVYRTQKALDTSVKAAERLQQHGVHHNVLNVKQIQMEEPALRENFVGAIHWTDPISIRNPGGLVKAYAKLFEQRGGHFYQGNALDLQQSATAEWEILDIKSDMIQAKEVIIALGPWSTSLTKRFGYTPPLFVKRGYHMHFSNSGSVPLNKTVLDAERGYLVAPMEQGLRLATGAELAHLDAPSTPNQLDDAEQIARNVFPLGKRLDAEAWKGARPCMPDMKPVIGALPHTKGLWCAFGHGHQGFTLGPATGELLADIMVGDQPKIDPLPFSPSREFWNS